MTLKEWARDITLMLQYNSDLSLEDRILGVEIRLMQIRDELRNTGIDVKDISHLLNGPPAEGTN